MWFSRLWIPSCFYLLTCLACTPAPQDSATLILTGDRLWTGNPEQPWAEAVAVREDRLLAVGSREELSRYQGASTRLIELAGGFILPGFIDSHTHFNRAAELLLGVNLLEVADEESLIKAVREACERLPAGSWLIGGDWGAYEAWGQGSTGQGSIGESSPVDPFLPHRSMIDPVSLEHPALLSKWDRSSYLANSRALEAASVSCEWRGVNCDRDGEPTGRLSAEAADRVRAVIPPKSMHQRLAEARVAMARLRELGVTGIHDITPPEQLRAFLELQQRQELSVRIYARPTLDKWEHLAALGIEHGFGNEWLRIGGLKGFVDGIMGNSSARFYEPYLTSGQRGSWRTMMEPAGNMERLLTGADAAGHVPQVHAIGDEAIDHLLDLFARLEEVNGAADRRLRMIHAQVLRGPEVADRMAAMGVIAEVQPYHTIDDMRWMEERIGERSRWAYAFRTLSDAGVTLSFGSDWPGTNASWYPASPVLGIYAAVTRQTLEGQPSEGWYPEERLDVETALRAYTTNNAWAAGEGSLKGSLEPGKLADLVVLSDDPFTLEPSRLKDVRVLLTMVGGDIVHQRD